MLKHSPVALAWNAETTNATTNYVIINDNNINRTDWEMRVRWLVKKYQNITNGGSTDRNIYQRWIVVVDTLAWEAELTRILFHFNSKNKNQEYQDVR